MAFSRLFIYTFQRELFVIIIEYSVQNCPIAPVFHGFCKASGQVQELTPDP
jgi:hypothetical protein